MSVNIKTTNRSDVVEVREQYRKWDYRKSPVKMAAVQGASVAAVGLATTKSPQRSMIDGSIAAACGFASDYVLDDILKLTYRKEELKLWRPLAAGLLYALSTLAQPNGRSFVANFLLGVGSKYAAETLYGDHGATLSAWEHNTSDDPLNHLDLGSHSVDGKYGRPSATATGLISTGQGINENSYRTVDM